LPPKAAKDPARLTPQPKKMDDRTWKTAKAASGFVSMSWDAIRRKFAQENKIFIVIQIEHRFF
jgi:hypothetical protein